VPLLLWRPSRNMTPKCCQRFCSHQPTYDDKIQTKSPARGGGVLDVDESLPVSTRLTPCIPFALLAWRSCDTCGATPYDELALECMHHEMSMHEKTLPCPPRVLIIPCRGIFKLDAASTAH
jgi:hypothetical protein